MSITAQESDRLIAEGGIGWSREGMAQRVARDLEPGVYVNLGIGVPQLVAEFVTDEEEIFFHSENGILGLGPAAPSDREDPDLTDAGKRFVTLAPGAAIFDSSMSFAMIRGGHVTYSILGAFEVAVGGDLANWSVPGRTPGVGGAMDLAANAKILWALLQHRDKKGNSKLLNACTLPITGTGCVDRVFTDLGVFDPIGTAFKVVDLAPGVTRELVEEATEGPLDWTGYDK